MRVAGFGLRDGASIASLREALALAEAQAGPATAFASLAVKTAHPALQGLASERGVALLPVSVAGVETLTRSPRVQALHGTGSVAEAAALAGAGRDAVIEVARKISSDGMATCAIALGKGPTE